MNLLISALVAFVWTTCGTPARSEGAEEIPLDSFNQNEAENAHKLQKRANIPRYVGKRNFLIPADDSAYDNVDFDSLKSILRYVLSNPGEDLSDIILESEASKTPGISKESALQGTQESIEKRRQPLFVGRRRAPLFIGKRQPVPSSLIVGKRQAPNFVGRRGAAPIFVGKRRAPIFVGRRGAPLFLGRRSDEDIDNYVYGERSVLASDENMLYDTNNEIANNFGFDTAQTHDKRAWGRYIPWEEMEKMYSQSPFNQIAKRFAVPEFVGKRDPAYLDLPETENLHYFHNDRTNPNTGLFSKRFDTPMFIGRRSFDLSNSNQNFETLNTEFKEENDFFDDYQNIPKRRGANFHSVMDTVK